MPSLGILQSPKLDPEGLSFLLASGEDSSLEGRVKVQKIIVNDENLVVHGVLDRALWINVSEGVVETSGNQSATQSATDRTQNRGPEPILSAIGENCGANDGLDMSTRWSRIMVPSNP
jgi:hypothetical protein